MLLAVDCSTRWVGLALYDGATVLSEEIWQSQNHHTVEISPAIDLLFRRTGIRQSELSSIGVAMGPGSFTSLRIGLAVVKGLALALHIPVVGIPTLDILAAAQPIQKLPMACVLQAGRNRLAVGWYQVEKTGWVCPDPPAVMTVDELSQKIQSPTVVCGELSAEERQLLGRKKKMVLLASPANSVRRPSFLAELAWNRWQAGQLDDVVTLSPYYLHVADPIPE